MPSREEIREGAIVSLMDYKGFHRAPTEYIIDRMLSYLHSQGVVIKHKKDDVGCGCKICLGDSGLTRTIVEPLIKEPDGNQDKN